MQKQMGTKDLWTLTDQSINQIKADRKPCAEIKYIETAFEGRVGSKADYGPEKK